MSLLGNYFFAKDISIANIYELRKALDPSEIGAVPLLGLDGLVFVGHGRSDDRAMYNAIIKARQAVSANLLETLSSAIQEAL